MLFCFEVPYYQLIGPPKTLCWGIVLFKYCFRRLFEFSFGKIKQERIYFLKNAPTIFWVFVCIYRSATWKTTIIVDFHSLIILHTTKSENKHSQCKQPEIFFICIIYYNLLRSQITTEKSSPRVRKYLLKKGWVLLFWEEIYCDRDSIEITRCKTDGWSRGVTRM